jgi:hypothetical protein
MAVQNEPETAQPRSQSVLRSNHLDGGGLVKYPG